MSIDPLRHLEVFKPEAFGEQQVTVIGLGATGSRIAMSLAKLGIKNLHIYDFDKIEYHNVANQLFGNKQVKQGKCECLASMIEDSTDIKPKWFNKEVTGSESLGQYVFLLTDTMKSRKEIWEKGLKLNPQIKLLVETRMDVDNGRIYAINPLNSTHIDEYENTFYDDEKTVTSACGATSTVGSTAEIISGFAVWEFIKFCDPNKKITNETIFSLNPLFLTTRNF